MSLFIKWPSNRLSPFYSLSPRRSIYLFQNWYKCMYVLFFLNIHKSINYESRQKYGVSPPCVKRKAVISQRCARQPSKTMYLSPIDSLSLIYRRFILNLSYIYRSSVTFIRGKFLSSNHQTLPLLMRWWNVVVVVVVVGNYVKSRAG